MFAGAAFTDSADIKVDTEVVDTLVSLGVVNGYDDGSFKPNGTVTRAEMAKMIYVLRTGNSDASAYNDDKTSFTDIGSHWARGYIKYCQSLGIIAGKSNTKFVPNEKVSAQEAAKMLLVTLGYDAQKAGLVGTGWASKTNALADENGLLEDVNTSFTSACPRQYAAQLIYNAIDAETVVLRDGAYTDESALGIPNKTVGEKYMGLSKTEGVLVASGKTGINGQSTAKEDSLGVNVLTTNAAGVTETAYDYAADVTFTKVAKDYTALLGQVVKVLYKDGDKSKVYGVFATDDNNVLAGNSTDLEKKTATKVKFDGTEYDVAATTLVTVNGVKKSVALADAADQYKDTAATFSLVDNNDDDKYDVLTVFAPSVVKVTYAGSNSITAGKSYKYADENIADGIKKDDYVAIIDKAATKDGKYNITKAETVTGKVEAIKGTDVKINGTWYKQATGADIEDTYSLNDTFTLAVVNGFVYHAEQGDDAISNDKVVLITKADDAKNAGIDAGTQKVKALFADGTEKQITVAQLDKDGNGYKDMKDSATPATAVEAAVNTLYTFTTKSNGDYKLKVMDSTKYDGTLSNIAKIDDGKAYNSSSPASTMRFADSAAIFVVPAKAGDDAKVITGKALGTWKNITDIDGTNTVLYGKKDGGIVYANVGVVVMNNNAAAPSSGDVEYGFVTADSSLVKDGDDYYVSMTIWNGSSEISVKADSYYEFNATDKFVGKTDVDESTHVKNYTNSSKDYTVAFAKKTPISYKTTGDGIISEVRPLNVVDGDYLGAVAVTGYSGKKFVSLKGNTGASVDYDLTSDTVQMFVDTDAKTGEAKGSITEANEVHGYFVKNAYAVKNSSGEIEFILVDTQNNLECNASEDDVVLTKGSGLANVVINNTDRVVELKGDTVAKTDVNTSASNGIAVAGAGKVIVNAAGTNLAAGDVIRVIAENGDVVDYTVK